MFVDIGWIIFITIFVVGWTALGVFVIVHSCRENQELVKENEDLISKNNEAGLAIRRHIKTIIKLRK